MKDIGKLKPKLVDVLLNEALNNDELSERLALSLLNSVDTDDENPTRMGRYFAKAYLEKNMDDLLIAICGWSMQSLLEFALSPENEEDDADE